MNSTSNTDSYSVEIKKGVYTDKFREVIYKDKDIQGEAYLFTDINLYQSDSYNFKYSLGLLLEPPEIMQSVYDWIIQPENYNKFYKIFTHNKELLSTDPRFIFYPFGGRWIDDCQIYDKTKLISIIASNKNQTTGHKLRHSIIKKFGQYLNGIYGTGYKQVENKITALQDFCYSIVIENTKVDYFFTEKLLDCFATGTVPIYWGCPSIKDFFDEDGIIVIEDEFDLYHKIKNLSYEDYKNRLPHIKNNFNFMNKYSTRVF